ncbi:protein OBERON 4 [Cornus florida]|uniref:protein OBERON 4 n=1 Tax=Cornus florida TaxID=4283 RepID=UPI0028975113|nr:protein OBERON 4 [Cornus florida]XP_059651869.1 protein OBERON 4 [Cornus florida]
MKRLRSSDDLDSFGDKGVSRDWGRRDDDSSLSRSLSYRSYYKSENGRKGLSSSSSRYDRLEDDRESSRPVRKRPDYDVDNYDRRKSYDRYRDISDRGILSSSPRGGYGGDRIHRTESFSGPRREFPKGFRSERDRSRREGSVSSWRRFGGGKDVDESTRTVGEFVKGSRVASDDIGKVRSPQGLRDAKSPAWSRDAISPAWSRDAKSPAWSKDSGSEQSKSVEVKKSEDLQVESGNTSEMEEGELEPDPEPVLEVEPVAEDQASVGFNSDKKELESEHLDENKRLEDGSKSSSEENIELNKSSVSVEKPKDGSLEPVQDVKEVNCIPDCQGNLIHETSGCGDVIGTAADDEGGKVEESARENSNPEKEESNDRFAEKSPHLEEKHKEDRDIDLDVKAENMDLAEPSKKVAEENRASEVVLSLVTEEITQNFKDKGKNVAVLPSNVTYSAEDGVKNERESGGLLTHRDSEMEGPSTRGFELFFTDPVRKLEKADSSGVTKPRDENLALEPLELSLSLPNVLLPIGSHCMAQAPGSPSHGRSVQSFPSTFRTNSDGFAASMSFSGSQPFTHNPSCSLTQNSFDNYEHSVGSRPIFQGGDQVSPWQGQSSNEHKNKEAPMYQRISSNGNGIYHQSQASQGILNGQAVHGQHIRVAEGSSRIPVGLDRQLSIHKQLSGTQSRHQNDVRSPSQSVGSHETGSEFSKDKKRVMREKNGGSLYKSSNQNGKGQLLMGGADFVDRYITMIVSEPLHVMARRFNEMTGESVACLKEAVRDIILSPGKQWQLCALQKALQNRADITLEMLQKSHRAQLEILVVLKTGLQEFFQRNYDIPSSDLAEIYLNLRCRNLTCRNLLPVDECDCKICVQKNGFCSACMCLVCSKFDMASNTCSWVGCDVCLHWCHADCALRESYVRNGRSATGAQGTTEMQFHCVACDHPSEMFGFVKEVFQNFAKDWTAETLSKELEYVRRIFCASEDVRGKRLHDISVQLLSRLTNKSDLHEVRFRIMGFLTGTDSFKSGNTPIVSGKELFIKNHGEGNNGITGPSQEALWLKSVYSEKASQLEKDAGLLTSFDHGLKDKRTVISDLQRSTQKEPIFDELESIVKIKHAEARMFQTRADDARREAEGLKRIAIAKNEKIDEEYTSRIRKLRLAEAEEMRKQKFEELQALERAHLEYFNMKRRMEADIKDLLLKMEATKRNLAM